MPQKHIILTTAKFYGIMQTDKDFQGKNPADAEENRRGSINLSSERKEPMRTVKRKVISIILLFIVSTMMIGIFSGCEGTGNDSDSPENEQYILSQEEFDEINAAWRKFWNQDKNLADSRELMDEYFRGRYGDCIVLKTSTITGDYSQYEIAGYEFRYGGQLFVVHDSTIYSLTSAYEYGLLTESDIKQINDIISGKK